MATVNILPAFGYKWAETGTVEALDDAQYKAGWAFIGATPPSVEQFNKVHQIADEKANYLYGQMSAVFTAGGQVPAAGTPTTLRDAIAAIYGGGRKIGYRVITSTQTYTPTPGTTSVVVTVVGGGGGGGGAGASGSGQVSIGAGGGGGGFAIRRLTSDFSGATITIGAAGTPGPAGGNGGNGGTTSFGALVSATGGGGGAGFVAGTPSTQPNGTGSPGAGTVGDVMGRGGIGWYGLSSPVAVSGAGGGSLLGGQTPWVNNTSNGQNANSYGCGGSGACCTGVVAGGAQGGLAGTGVCIVEEYA